MSDVMPYERISSHTYHHRSLGRCTLSNPLMVQNDPPLCMDEPVSLEIDCSLGETGEVDEDLTHFENS